MARQHGKSGWSMMWVLCMFDIPVGTKAQRRRATQFRNVLLDKGFMMKQFSVYIKPCSSLQSAKNTTTNLKNYIPNDSMVSFLYITDKQYASADNYIGKNATENEQQIREKNGQILLF